MICLLGCLRNQRPRIATHASDLIQGPSNSSLALPELGREDVAITVSSDGRARCFVSARLTLYWKPPRRLFLQRHSSRRRPPPEPNLESSVLASPRVR